MYESNQNTLLNCFSMSVLYMYKKMQMFLSIGPKKYYMVKQYPNF